MKRSPLVRASHNELLEFIRFYRYRGTPTIIGGWAVYFYNPYFGSVDIDVVGSSYEGTFESIIEEYERTHGYEFVGDSLGIEMAARRPIVVKGKRVGEMEIDACSYERPGASRFHEDEALELPYSACEDDGCKKEVRVSRDCVCYVPCKELLLLYKIKARRDRRFDIRTKGGTIGEARLQWLRAKAIKDGSDILALLDPQIRRSLAPIRMNYPKMKRLSVQYGLKEVVSNTIGDVLEDDQAWEQYGRRFRQSGVVRVIEAMSSRGGPGRK